MTLPQTRTRLTPEARRDQLLDTAKRMIVDDGLQAFTMEGLARAAGVSAPLVYNYFAGRPELLQELLVREYRHFIAEAVEATRAARDFEDIVRISVASNFDHHAPGNILPVLLGQQEIAAVIASERAEHRKQNARFLVRAAADSYHLTRRQAQLAVSMSSGASIAAAEFAATTGASREETIEMAMGYILSGIESIARRSTE
jgi:AcrR family transcriptional regulator